MTAFIAYNKKIPDLNINFASHGQRKQTTSKAWEHVLHPNLRTCNKSVQFHRFLILTYIRTTENRDKVLVKERIQRITPRFNMKKIPILCPLTSNPSPQRLNPT